MARIRRARGRPQPCRFCWCVPARLPAEQAAQEKSGSRHTPGPATHLLTHSTEHNDGSSNNGGELLQQALLGVVDLVGVCPVGQPLALLPAQEVGGTFAAAWRRMWDPA